MKRTTPTKLHTANAFAMLMEGSSKKKKMARDQSSRFVLCPAGCGKHLPIDRDINAHLDICMANTFVQTQESIIPSMTPESLSDGDHQSTRDPACISQSETEENTSPLIPSQKPTKKPTGKVSTPPRNIFSHMMKHSAKVFSTKEPPKLQQRFHLHSNGSISLTCYNRNKVEKPNNNKIKNSSSEPEEEGIRWNTTVHLSAPRGRAASTRDNVANDSDAESCPESSAVDLLITSDIDSIPRNSRRRLVQRHSRLSIPVLKSILQKSIRRRRPLPAVRVAMELADKSLGDLLRRLPIIILEDSFLHPSFSFLTWLMVAYSKDFEPDLFLLRKVLCVVYEIASCPWQDHLLTDEETADFEQSLALSFDLFHKQGVDNLLEDNELTIWSMLLRKRYGGMGCDIRMLQLYANIWKKRFGKNTEVPHVAKERLKNFISDTGTLKWSELPARLHQTPMRQSLPRVIEMTDQSFCSLQLADITTEGVDFHCSGIIKYLLSDREIVDRFQGSLAPLIVEKDLARPPQSHLERRSRLERVLKRCMWNYSAGINRRLSITQVQLKVAGGVNKAEKELEDVWKTLIEPKARLYAQRYVRDKLAVANLS